MPGPVSESYQGPDDDSPYVPAHCYSKGPRMCPCGHHEGYHNDQGECLLRYKCACTGIPESQVTPLGE